MYGWIGYFNSSLLDKVQLSIPIAEHRAAIENVLMVFEVEAKGDLQDNRPNTNISDSQDILVCIQNDNTKERLEDIRFLGSSTSAKFPHLRNGNIYVVLHTMVI